MPDIKVFCETCEIYYSVDSSYAGMDVQCPECKKMLHVPEDHEKDKTLNSNKDVSRKNENKIQFQNIDTFIVPWFVVLFEVFGWLAFGAAGVLLAFVVAALLSGNYEAAFSCFLAFLCSGFMWFVVLFISRVAAAVCRTAFYTEKLYFLNKYRNNP